MEFEDILKDVGDFGPYQILLIILFLVPISTIIPWISFNAVFLASTPDHWCHVPELDSLDLSLEDQKRLIRPPADPFCTRYDVNFTQILSLSNVTVDPNWPVIKCDSGWRYDNTNYDETLVTKWDLVCDKEYYKSLIASLVFAGVLFGTPIYGYLSDRYGRKTSFLGLTLLLSLCELASAFSPYLSLFLVFRVLIGTTMTSLYSLAYIIILELVKPELRGRINGIATNCWTIGMCLLSLVAYFTRSWFYLTIIMSLGSGIILLYYSLLPESPSWLICQGRYDEAAKVLYRVSTANKKQVKHEQILQNIQILGKLKKEEKCSPSDFLRYPTLRYRFILFTIMWIGVALPYYGLQFNVTNLLGNEFVNFFLVSAVELPAHLIAWWLLGTIGRRKTLYSGCIVSGITCLIPSVLPHDYENVGVIVSIVAKAGAGASFMAQYQLGPEIFPTPLRSAGMGFTSTIGTGATLIVPYIVQLERYGSHVPFLIFALSSVIAGICSIFLPETLNMNLPQTVEDVERLGKNEGVLTCWPCSVKEYDLENKRNKNLPDTIPPFSISKDVNDVSNFTAYKTFDQ